MVQSLVKVNLHIVFSTKERIPFIHQKIEKDLHAYMAGICKTLGSIPYEIGGIEDHVHLLTSLSKTVAISDFIGKIKSNSSRWAKGLGNDFLNFTWQKGYGAFAVDESSFSNVRKYIMNQREHHRGCDFKKEFIMLLKRYNVSYDEKYLWD